jgi:hypothetical protein
MAKPNKVHQLQEKIRQTVEKLGEALNEWLTKQRPQPQRVPVPIERPYRKQSPGNNY